MRKSKQKNHVRKIMRKRKRASCVERKISRKKQLKSISNKKENDKSK